MSWIDAGIRSLAIVAYFLVATVWLPNFLLGLGSVSRADPVVQDVVAAGSWLIGLGFGLWLLRAAQRRGAI